MIKYLIFGRSIQPPLQSAIIKKMAACRSEKHFFLKFKSAAKTLKKYVTNHINLTKFAFFPMKIFVSLATSSVKIMDFQIQ